ncbi:MAG: lipopolysaccharide heptosyltransferase II [Phycisphaeraceae bacterium]
MPARRARQVAPPQRLLVVTPTWLGDVVMATPTLRALRELYPQAHIAGLIRDNVQPILAGCPWLDEIIHFNPNQGDQRPLRLARQLALQRFDMAVLLPNSFRAALAVALARIPRRVGYDRDGRGLLLTDRLLPRRGRQGYVPTPTREYYLGLARYLGTTAVDPAMHLAVTPDETAAGDALLRAAGHNPQASDRPLVLLNPGANFGDAKMWPPARFAAVGDRCVRERDAVVAVTAAPNEREIVDKLLAAAETPLLDLAAHGLNLHSLKAVIRRASLVVTNDTGPRHVAAALGTPVVTLFGPTDPRWTTLGFARERIARVDLWCSPCQKKQCPLAGTPDELQCMHQVTPDMVFAHAAELLKIRNHRDTEAQKRS